MKEILQAKEMWVIALVSAALFVLTYLYAQEFSSFTAGIFRVTIVILLLVSVDIFVLKDIDTIDEIKKNNTAFGLLLLALAVIIHAGFASV